MRLLQGRRSYGTGVLGHHEQGSLAPVEAEEKRGGGCGIGWIEGRRKLVVVGSMWNSRRILERVAAAMTGGWDISLNFRVGPVYIVRG